MKESTVRLSRQDFKKLGSTKRAQSSFFFMAYTQPIPGFLGKVAVVVSKKVAPKSVDRHLFKRRVMHALRVLPKRNYSVVVTAKNGSAHLQYSDILKELTALLSRV